MVTTQKLNLLFGKLWQTIQDWANKEMEFTLKDSNFFEVIIDVSNNTMSKA